MSQGRRLGETRDGRVRRTKHQAIDDGTSLSTLVERVLVEYLDRRKETST